MGGVGKSALVHEVCDRAGDGHALDNMGDLARDHSRPEEAARYYEQALAIFEEIGAVDSARIVRRNLAALRTGFGRLSWHGPVSYPPAMAGMMLTSSPSRSAVC